jgi:hypothetical protein
MMPKTLLRRHARDALHRADDAGDLYDRARFVMFAADYEGLAEEIHERQALYPAAEVSSAIEPIAL